MRLGGWMGDRHLACLLERFRRGSLSPLACAQMVASFSRPLVMQHPRDGRLGVVHKEEEV